MKQTLIIIFLLLSLTSFAQTHLTNHQRQMLVEFDKLLNKPFPAFELEDENGNLFNTASLKGKTLYVDFWFTQCPPCLAEIPYSKALKAFFAADTNIVFLNVCIENKERKQAWKDMIKQKEMGGIHLFYAKNQPQKINLLREYKVENFPTYMLVNNSFNIIGYNAPVPSEKPWVQWSIYNATKSIKLSDSFTSLIKKTKEAGDYMKANMSLIDSLYPSKK